MFDFLKKKDEKKSEPTPQPAATPPPVVLETGKEIQFQDPKTGMYVYQRPFSDEHRKLVVEAMKNQGVVVSQFIDITRQYLAWQERMIAAEKSIKASEQTMNTIMDKIRDELKLDKRWGLNPQLVVLEKREPPG